MNNGTARNDSVRDVPAGNAAVDSQEAATPVEVATWRGIFALPENPLFEVALPEGLPPVSGGVCSRRQPHI